MKNQSTLKWLVTLGLGVIAMAINLARMGAPESIGIMIPLLVITLLNLVMVALLLKNVETSPMGGRLSASLSTAPDIRR